MRIFVALLLQAWLATPLFSRHVDPRVRVRGRSPALPKRAPPGNRPSKGRNCGAFRMNCGNAAGACNNGAFYQNCMSSQKGNTYYTFNSNINNNDNRKYSGCEPSTGNAVCNGMG